MSIVPRLLNVVSPQLIKHVTVSVLWGSALLWAAHQKPNQGHSLADENNKLTLFPINQQFILEFQNRGVKKQRNAPKEKASQRKRRA
jgi:hypothetical protein